MCDLLKTYNSKSSGFNKYKYIIKKHKRIKTNKNELINIRKIKNRKIKNKK